MANHSESTDKSSSDRDRQSGSSTQMSGNQKSGTGSGTSGSQDRSPQDDQGSGEMGPMHTNAGSTGFSSDQISPKTQNMPQTGPSASHPASHQGSSDKKR